MVKYLDYICTIAYLYIIRNKQKPKDMKATASYSKVRDEKGNVCVNYFIENVETGSELEKKLEGLNYIYMGWGQYKVIVRTAEELDAKRNPIMEYLK
jgi:hypothetical protein